MKKYLSVVLTLIATCAFAQSAKTPAIQKKLDNLYQVLNTTKNDTVKCITYYQIANLVQRPDSAIYNLNTGLRLAQAKNFVRGIGTGKGSLGSYFMKAGNYPASLKNLFEAVVIFKGLKRPKNVISCYLYISSVYDDLKQEQKAIDYANLAMQIAKQQHNDLVLEVIYGNMAYYYTNLKMYDRALKYCYLEQELALQKHLKGSVFADIYDDFGTVYIGLGQYDLGLLYLRKGAAIAEKMNDYRLQFYSYSPMSAYYEKVGLMDSARFYGEKALTGAIAYRYDAMILPATETLARLNVNYDNAKSIKLYQQAISINKRIFDTEKTRETENLTINEQQRQQDLINEQQKADEEHKENLQLAGIALFIPFFLVLALALSRTKVPHKVIESMSVLSLLLVFEFITLLVHPFVEKLTHNTPVFVYLLLVILAAGLVPLHHNLTHWLKEKLAHVHSLHLTETKHTVAADTGTTAARDKN
jgi:tetratricopeptide (TPR) repeat protein